MSYRETNKVNDLPDEIKRLKYVESTDDNGSQASSAGRPVGKAVRVFDLEADKIKAVNRKRMKGPVLALTACFLLTLAFDKIGLEEAGNISFFVMLFWSVIILMRAVLNMNNPEDVYGSGAPAFPHRDILRLKPKSETVDGTDVNGVRGSVSEIVKSAAEIRIVLQPMGHDEDDVMQKIDRLLNNANLLTTSELQSVNRAVAEIHSILISEKAAMGLGYDDTYKLTRGAIQVVGEGLEGVIEDVRQRTLREAQVSSAFLREKFGRSK